MENFESIITTNIETDIFYSIIEYLEKDNWEIVVEYDEKIFDEGIDFDFYELCRGDKKKD